MMSQFRNRFVIKRSNGAGEVVIEWKSLEVRRETIHHLYVNEKIFYHYANTNDFGSISGCVIKPLLLLSKDATVYRSRVREYHKWIRKGKLASKWTNEWANNYSLPSLSLSQNTLSDARIMKLVWRTSGRFIWIKDRIDRYIDAVDRHSIEIQSSDSRIKIKWLAVTKLHLIKLIEINLYIYISSCFKSKKFLTNWIITCLLI